MLLGTGAAGGWPNPFCSCGSCEAALSAGEVRAPTSVLVDDVLLLDPGPETPTAAVRHGRTLAPVEHVLRTHPATARPGDRLEVGSHRVLALDTGRDDGGVGYDVSGPDGGRLLYAPGAGVLPGSTLTATEDARYHLVLLGLVGTGSFAGTLAALRRAGAVTDATQVVAVDLGHDNPPTGELDRQLADWGASTVADGTVRVVGPDVPDDVAVDPLPARLPRRTLVLGGARSGKSTEAERLLSAEPTVTYVATGGERDEPDWRARVAAHRARRPAGWHTVETTDLVPLLRDAAHPLLVDCLTLWLTAVLDEAGAWHGEWDDGLAAQKVAARTDELVAAWRAVRVPVVAVSNEVGSGIVPATAAGGLFRDLMGRLNARIAAESDAVRLVVAGRVVPL